MIWTTERQGAARAEAAKWSGTKHQNRLALLGEGIDCVHLISEILHAAGICEKFPMPFYDERLGALRTHNVIEDILTTFLFSEANPAETAPEFGDIVVCRCGKQTNHVGIILDGAMWHVPGRGRVGPAAWPYWQPRTQSLVRITGIGYRTDPTTLTWGTIKSRI